ncbi:MAG: ribosome small subunit-dependent GTPase A [Planctomycetaceae bacterium]
MTGKRPKKVRVEFRKNRAGRAREQNLTHKALEDLDAAADRQQSERLTGKGAITRRRTVLADGDVGSALPQLAVDAERCMAGRVLRAIGANHCSVQGGDGRVLECTVRRLVRTMSRDVRNAVVVGDQVLVEPQDDWHGVIVRVETRRTTISRGSDRHEHVIAANIDQAVIVTSAAEPQLKPALVDRFIVSAEKGGVRPVVCISKVDLVDRPDLEHVADIYRRIGYDVVLSSIVTGEGIEPLRSILHDRVSVVAGQSGVGKSSLINALDSSQQLATGGVSEDSGKGRHTTRVAALLPLASGGWIVDTPGIRQMQLWDVAPFEIEGYFRDFLPHIPHCRFPDCTHSHEHSCAVKQAVERGEIASLRYQGYLRMLLGDE